LKPPNPIKELTPQHLKTKELETAKPYYITYTTTVTKYNQHCED